MVANVDVVCCNLTSVDEILVRCNDMRDSEEYHPFKYNVKVRCRLTIINQLQPYRRGPPNAPPKPELGGADPKGVLPNPPVLLDCPKPPPPNTELEPWFCCVPGSS